MSKNVGRAIGQGLSTGAAIWGSKRRAVSFVRQGVDPVEAAYRATYSIFWIYLLGCVTIVTLMVDVPLAWVYVQKPFGLMHHPLLLASWLGSLGIFWLILRGIQVRAWVAEERWTPRQRRSARPLRIFLLCALWWPTALFGIVWTSWTDRQDVQQNCEHYAAVSDIAGYARCARETESS